MHACTILCAVAFLTAAEGIMMSTKPIEQLMHHVDILDLDFHSSVGEMHQELERLSDEMEELTTVVETNGKALKQQQAKMIANQQLSTSTSKETGANQANIDKLLDEVEDLTTAVKTNSKVLKQQQAKTLANQQLSTSNSKEIAASHTSIDQLSDEVEKLTTAVEANSKVLKQQQAKMQANQQLSTSHSKEIAANQASIADITDDITKMESANNNLRKQIQNPRKAMQKLTNDINMLRADVEALKSSNYSSSCYDVRMRQPNSPSGDYIISTPNGDLKVVRCQMDHTFCGEGEWMRVGHLDMQNLIEICPAQFRLYEENGKRACGRPTGGPGCASITFPTGGIRYTEVCGRVAGYQYASPDAVDHHIGTGHNDINSHYVDGISITHGSPSRQHIWTYMAGVTDSNSANYWCPCNEGSSVAVQEFIGDSYYCESGAVNGWGRQLYPDDVLWDGEQCTGREGPCCQFQDLPWFRKAIDGGSTDDIELRICADQPTHDEDVPISLYEIYVK